MIVAEHSSGRFDVKPTVLEQALAQQLVDEPDFLSLTEMMAEDRAAVLRGFPAYDVARATGADGRDECALLVRLATHRIVSFRVVALSDKPIPRRGGSLCYALVVVVEDLETHKRHTRIVIHMPSGVEGKSGLLRNDQATVYRDAIGGLRRLAAAIDGPLAITGDFNLSLRLKWVRDYLTMQFPRFAATWRGGNLPQLGTLGDRVIDFSLVRGFSVPTAQVTSAFGASDHRAIRETHKETPMATTPKTDAFVAALRRRGVEVLLHKDWGSVHADVYRNRLTSHPHGLLPAKPVDTLWHHITVTRDDGTLVGDFKADCREVERIGFERFGSGVSYNILVDHNATKPRVALGQFLEAKGTHTVNDKGIEGYSYNQNLVSLAVAWVGMPGNKLNAHAVTAFVQVAAALIEVGALTDHYDSVPHSLVAAKECPTDELRDRLAAIKGAALQAARPAPVVTKQTPRWDLIWETANAIAVDNARGTADGDTARRIRTDAAPFSTKH